jgi:phage tail-like protein
MESPRERPFPGSHFLVSIDDADGRAAAAGFAEVFFPPLVIDRRTREPGTPHEPPAGHVLVLRRGVTGRLDLYQWWHEARRLPAEPPYRTVTVQVLGDDHATVGLTWRFLRAHPVSLSYSPLRAMDDSVLMETIELAFASVEIS